MNTSHDTNLKGYLKLLFDLESAIYTHKKLITDYTNDRDLNKPLKPQQSKLPPKPDLSKIISSENRKNEKSESNGAISLKTGVLAYLGIMISLGALILFFSIITIDPFYRSDSWGLIMFIDIIALLIGGYCIYLLYKGHKEKEQQKVDTMKEAETKARSIYNEQMAKYNETELALKKSYNNSLVIFERELSQYNEVTINKILELKEVLNTLEKARNDLYSQNIVYAKYRNIVAISTIYEYFESGRCNTLEGPNGAYNMFEGELRSNIIIASLSQIISDLEQIKNNQYALFQQINNSNKVVCDLLNDINNSQLLTAYYANMAALAASADRYTVGMVF